MRARSCRLTALALVCGLAGCGSSDDESAPAPSTAEAPDEDERREEFCDALATLRTIQLGWTVEYLAGLDAQEAEANRAEQVEADAPVRALLPTRFEEAAAQLAAVTDEVVIRIEDLRPGDGTLEQPLSSARSLGYGSLTEFVFRDGIEIDGHVWTFDEYIERGNEYAANLDEYCDGPIL